MGKIKHKGRYQFEGFGWHQNQSAIIVPKAAVQCLIHGKDIEDFILNHDDIYDFMLRTKVPRSSRLVGEVRDEDGFIEKEVTLQNICRYYISNDGLHLVKVMPPVEGKEKETKILEKGGKKCYASKPQEITRLEKDGWVITGSTTDRRIGINAGYTVTVCNDINKFDGNINYQYYIDEARKLVDPLINNS